ncbi:MAG: diguanylate cyclase [Bacilli bacterium]|jgi:diguanylate cyclase (GGDEF)-like protein/PAS domain S-box-containing protein|nr:diguanylate cyclase [Bacilli bacterium]
MKEEWTKEQLINRIEELEILVDQLLAEQHQETELDYAWSGNLGHWYWNIKSNQVTFNPLKVTNLGYREDEIPHTVPYQFFTEKLHPDDHQRTMKAMMDHLYGKSPVYETEYRIQTRDGKYRWYYDRGKITKRDENNKPVFLAGIVFDITEKKLKEEQLQMANQDLTVQSLIDPLSNIANRRGLMLRLEEEVKEFKEKKNPLTIILFDIDHFKQINDTKGHLVGDEVIKEVSRLIQKGIRDIDMVGRYGGEEFLVILKNTNENIGRIIANRIREAIASHPFKDLTVQVSGGVSEYLGTSIADFIQDADDKLYQAKKSGRNKII